MTHNRDFFQPDSVDEQVDQFSLGLPNEFWIYQKQADESAQTETRRVQESWTPEQIEGQEEASMRLVRDLKAFYQVEYEQNHGFLEQAWKRIAAHQRANQAPAQAQDAFLSPSLLRSSQERTRMIHGQHPTDKSIGRKFLHRVSLLVATLVAMLLVGTLVAVLTLSHSYQSTAGASRKTPPILTMPTATVKSLPFGSVVFSTQALQAGTNVLPSFAWSPDSKRIATVVASQQGQQVQLHIWDATTGGHLKIVPLAANTGGDLLWSPTGRYLVLGNLQTLVIVDSQAGSIVNTISFSSFTASAASFMRQTSSIYMSTTILSAHIPAGGGFGFYSYAWTPDGSSLAVALSFRSNGKSYGKVELINPLTRAVQATFSTPTYPIGISMAFSGDGAYLAVSYPNDAKIVVWNVATRAVAFQLDDAQVDNIAWQPGTHNLARAMFSSAQIQVWDISSHKLLNTYTGGSSFTWSPDGKKLAVYTSFLDALPQPKAKTNEVAIFDAASGAQVARYMSQRTIYNAIWSPDGRYIASAETDSTNNRIVVWAA